MLKKLMKMVYNKYSTNIQQNGFARIVTVKFLTVQKAV